jgi:hypothetical protein
MYLNAVVKIATRQKSVLIIRGITKNKKDIYDLFFQAMGSEGRKPASATLQRYFFYYGGIYRAKKKVEVRPGVVPRLKRTEIYPRTRQEIRRAQTGGLKSLKGFLFLVSFDIHYSIFIIRYSTFDIQSFKGSSISCVFHLPFRRYDVALRPWNLDLGIWTLEFEFWTFLVGVRLKVAPRLKLFFVLYPFCLPL